jgi:hypothetical protein
MTESARILLEVTAGLIPGTPIPELTRTWAVTSAEWQKAADPLEAGSDVEVHRQFELLASRNGQALAYAGLLMMQPDRVNWVRSDWIYL